MFVTKTNRTRLSIIKVTRTSIDDWSSVYGFGGMPGHLIKTSYKQGKYTTQLDHFEYKIFYTEYNNKNSILV